MKVRFVGVIFAAGWLCACNAEYDATQDHSSANEPPTGLWVWTADQKDNVFSLVVTMTDGELLATIDGKATAATLNDDVVSITGPEGQTFVGQLAADQSSLQGHWMQPASPLDYQDVVTPIRLPAVSKGQWQAEVIAQPRPFRVYLDIFANDDAEFSAVIRNPEGNNTLRASQFRLDAVDDDGWVLIAGRGERERRHALQLGNNDQLQLAYDRFDQPMSLTRATESLARSYYSRQDRSQPSKPVAPAQLDDGWSVAAPERAGFDATALQTLTTTLSNADPRERRPQMIHSLLVSRGGKLVFEEYFFGHDRDMRHDVRSLGKVFGSVMVGALQQQGYSIDAGHRPVTDILEDAGRAIDDPRKADITLDHLMTFTSGLDCDANSDSSGSEMRMWEQQEEKDYWVFTAQLPMLHDPDTHYAYCSGSANLVGASLSSVGETSVHELFDRLIARPLQFGPYHWAVAPNGEGYLGGGAYMRPRDILKIGAMYLANGAWNGNQIIDEGWVSESTTSKIEISAQTTGMTEETFGNNYFGGSQAYIWRVDSVSVGERRYASYEASGNGGQLLIVVPEFDLAVVFTGGNYRMGGIWGRWRNQIIGGHIIPAITD